MRACAVGAVGEYSSALVGYSVVVLMLVNVSEGSPHWRRARQDLACWNRATGGTVTLLGFSLNDALMFGSVAHFRGRGVGQSKGKMASSMWHVFALVLGMYF